MVACHATDVFERYTGTLHVENLTGFLIYDSNDPFLYGERPVAERRHFGVEGEAAITIIEIQGLLNNVQIAYADPLPSLQIKAHVRRGGTLGNDALHKR